ncbi:14484_t:CDS:2, partial [Dentiscutata heterogama]
MNSISILCDSIFNNTYPELLLLHQQVEEFQTIYQSDVEVISNNLIEQYSYNQEELNKSIISDESNLNKPILNNEQINKFKKIYYKNKIEDNKNNNEDLIQKIKKKIEKKDKEAQYIKLQTTICCKEKYFQNLVFYEHAILTYQKFQNIKTTTTGQKRSRLA